MCSPPNCRFEIDDVRDEWTYPPDYFDFVHIRGLFGSISDWPALYKQVYRWVDPHDKEGNLKFFKSMSNDDRHLKPGAYIEQLEISIVVRALSAHCSIFPRNSNAVELPGSA